MVGILIRNRIGMEIYGTNTRIEQVDSEPSKPGEELEIDFQFECWLTPATIHRDGRDAISRWLKPRLAGRRDLIRSAFAAAGGRRDRSAGANRLAKSSDERQVSMKARLTLKVRAGAQQDGIQRASMERPGNCTSRRPGGWQG